jgi:hypothetical protein
VSSDPVGEDIEGLGEGCRARGGGGRHLVLRARMGQPDVGKAVTNERYWYCHGRYIP